MFQSITRTITHITEISLLNRDMIRLCRHLCLCTEVVSRVSDDVRLWDTMDSPDDSRISLDRSGSGRTVR